MNEYNGQATFRYPYANYQSKPKETSSGTQIKYIKKSPKKIDQNDIKIIETFYETSNRNHPDWGK